MQKNEGIISMIKRSSIHNYSCTPIQYTNIYNESERDSNTDRDNRYSTVRKRDSDNIDRDNSYSTVTKRDSDSISDHGGIEIDIDSDVKEERNSDIEGDDSVKRESEDEELCEKDGHNMRG